jgi:aminoglycoside phosphotransferase family enzyme/predicted kinase
MDTTEQAQERLVAAFAEGRVLGATGPIERVDTHLSHVFLCGDRAFKMKRAVRLPFVDFSTLAARQKACEAEVAVQAMARELYIGAFPVSRDADGFHIDGAGDVVDWVVVMRRFDRSQQFDRLAAKGVLTRAAVEEAAEAIANVHNESPAHRNAGYPIYYRSVIEGLRRTEADGARKLGLLPGSPQIFDSLEVELARVSSLIEDRREEGKVRRGHGDLHLRNLCLYQGRALAFDALEFDEAMATTDVLYDLAFLLMDLRRVGLDEHANAAMNRYWDVAEEDECALGLLGFFSSLRAAVRMAIAVEAGDLDEAQAYRELGLSLLQRTRPRLVAMGGLSGTGKSAVARSLAPRMSGPAGARLLRSDVLRKNKKGLALHDKAPAESYTMSQRANVYRALASSAAKASCAGASVVVDASFLVESGHALIKQAAGSAPLKGYWLDAPLDVRLARISGRKGDASDADVAVAAAQIAPSALPSWWRRVDADRPASAVVDEIVADLES